MEVVDFIPTTEDTILITEEIILTIIEETILTIEEIIQATEEIRYALALFALTLLPTQQVQLLLLTSNNQLLLQVKHQFKYPVTVTLILTLMIQKLQAQLTME